MASALKEIYPLTSLRFFAASLVVIEHLAMIPGLEWLGTQQGVLGRIGVAVFFVLSGYILAYSYGDRDWTGEFGKNAREFYWSRLARIYPLHWLMFVVALPLGLNSNTARVSVKNFPWLLTLTDKLWPGFPWMIQPAKVAWTLSCESLFYVCTPLVFVFLSRRKNRAGASAGLLLGYTALILVTAHLTPTLSWTAYLRMPEFLLGIAGFHLARETDFSRFAKLFVATGTACLALSGIWDSLAGWELHRLLDPIGAVLLILGCSTVSGALLAFLSRPSLVLLGHASFALYLFHDPFLRSWKVVFDRAGIVLGLPWNLLAAAALFACAVFGSVSCFKFYEHPARLKLRAWLLAGRLQPVTREIRPDAPLSG